MRSMTGYGRGQAVLNGSKISVELNSVNRKQSDVAVALPRELTSLDARVRDQVNLAVNRGRLNVTIALHRGESAQAVSLDRELARTYFRAMVELQKELGASGEVGIETILRAPGVLRAPEETVSPDELWPVVEKALKDAIADLVKMREREGKHLGRDLIKRLKIIRTAVRKIRTLVPAVVKRYRQTLHERLQRAGVDIPIDHDRLAKEIVLFADKTDITEELTRLDSHFKEFAHHLRKSEPIGRTLEFMCQEIARELNTTGAKANDAEISQLVISCKAEIEKIREQLSNIE